MANKEKINEILNMLQLMAMQRAVMLPDNIYGLISFIKELSAEIDTLQTEHFAAEQLSPTCAAKLRKAIR